MRRFSWGARPRSPIIANCASKIPHMIPQIRDRKDAVAGFHLEKDHTWLSQTAAPEKVTVPFGASKIGRRLSA